MTLTISATIGDRPRVWPIDGFPVRIGRIGSNTVQIEDRRVSREHAEIVERGGRLLLRDLRSRNGTLHNGLPVRRAVQVRLGDRIQVGSVSLRVTQMPSVAPTQPRGLSEHTSSLSIPVAQVLGEGPRGGAGSRTVVRLLERAGRLLVRHQSLRKTCEEFLCTVELAVPSSRLVLLLREDPCSMLTEFASRSRGERGPTPLRFSDSTLRLALDRKAAMMASDSVASPGPRARGAPRALARQSSVAVPLVYEEKALGILYADHDDPAHRYDRESLEILTLFANMAAARIANGRLLDAEKQHGRIDHELAMASRIQRWLLPSEEPLVEGYEMHAQLESCEAVGGDFYDIQATADGTVWILLGDVSGKGICGAILMSLFLSSARVLYDHCGGPGDLALQLNSALTRRGEINHFVTAFVGRLTPVTGDLRYVNAGHPAPLLLRGQELRTLDSTGLALGVTPGFDYREQSAQLAPGDLLALFTDGVPEARRGHEFFGDHRVVGALRAAALCPRLEEAGRNIMQEVDTFLAGGARSDDVALLLVRRGESQGGLP